jgi:hypothetical protein
MSLKRIDEVVGTLAGGKLLEDSSHHARTLDDHHRKE